MTVKLKCAEETIEYGKKISQKLNRGDVVSVYGELGAGKTTLIRGICKGLGYEGIVSSPSFTLINEYTGDIKLYHFDFYRLKTVDEVFNLGVDEFFFSDGICLLEWPDIAQVFLPEQTKNIFLEYDTINLNWRNIRTDFK